MSQDFGEFGDIPKKGIDARALETIKAMGKIKAQTWKDISQIVQGLNQLAEGGGIGEMVDSIKETVSLTIQDQLAPLTNEINQLIADALSPIQDMINDIVNELATFIGENKEGALVGAIGAKILLMFLPGGAIITAIVSVLGPLIGAHIQNLVDTLLEAESPEEVISGTSGVLGGLGTPALGLGFDLGIALFGGALTKETTTSTTTEDKRRDDPYSFE